jgi:hypothetical protein
MSEAKSAFGCTPEIIKAAQSDGAALNSAIAALCQADELDIEWLIQNNNADLEMSNQQYPQIEIRITLVGAKLKKGRATK